MAEDVVITDDSGDKSYFVLTPRIVWAICEDVYEYTLWSVIKDVAGDNGKCYVSTENLATLAMMSTGKVSECRKSLLEKNLIAGEIRPLPYGQGVWHITIPDVWKENVDFSRKYRSIAERVEYKKLQRRIWGKDSPSEGGEPSPDEGKPSPGETKNIPLRITTDPPAAPDDDVVEVGNKQGDKWTTSKKELFSDKTKPAWKEVDTEYVDLDDEGFPAKPISPLSRLLLSKGRKLTPNQQDKMASGVPLHNPRHPSPDQLFKTDPLFEVYILDKVAWASGGVDGQRRQTGALVSAIRNYGTEKFGWFDFKQSREEKVGETTHTPAPDYQPDIPEYDDDLGEWAAAKAGSMPLKKEMVWSKDLEASDGI